MVATRSHVHAVTAPQFTMAGFSFAADCFDLQCIFDFPGPNLQTKTTPLRNTPAHTISAKCSPEGTSLGVPPNGWPRPLRRSAVVWPPSRIPSTTLSVKPQASRSLPETTAALPQILPSSSAVAPDTRVFPASPTAWKSLRSRYAQKADNTRRGMPHLKKTSDISLTPRVQLGDDHRTPPGAPRYVYSVNPSSSEASSPPRSPARTSCCVPSSSAMISRTLSRLSATSSPRLNTFVRRLSLGFVVIDI